MTPAFNVWMPSPDSGTSTSTVVSAVAATSSSVWPTPTVSTRIRSNPNASSTSATSSVVVARPPCALRIRMESVSLDPGVFIRSMATRGAQGGLATTTEEVADVLEAFGFDRILIETVGVGQTELDVAATAETTVLVLVPESGDGIQTLKAGVMEIADVYVINKSDRPGADKLRQEVEVMLGIRRGNAFRHVAPHHTARPRAGKDGGGRGRAATTPSGSRRFSRLWRRAARESPSSPLPWTATTPILRRAVGW